MRIEGLDPFAIGHDPADGVSRVQFRRASRRKRQHGVVEDVAKRRQDPERDVVARVLLGVRSNSDNRSRYRDPLHLREDHVPLNGAGFVRCNVNSHAGGGNAKHSGLGNDLDDAGGQRNAHGPAERPHVAQQPPNDPRVARPRGVRDALAPATHAGASARLSSSFLVRIMPA